MCGSCTLVLLADGLELEWQEQVLESSQGPRVATHLDASAGDRLGCVELATDELVERSSAPRLIGTRLACKRRACVHRVKRMRQKLPIC
jgi:hypothetical protein